MGNAAKRLSMFRGARVPHLGLRRARGIRLAALAAVSGVVLFLPQSAPGAAL